MLALLWQPLAFKTPPSDIGYMQCRFVCGSGQGMRLDETRSRWPANKMICTESFSVFPSSNYSRLAHVSVQGYFFRMLPRRLYIYMAELRMQKARVKLLKRRAMAGSQH